MSVCKMCNQPIRWATTANGQKIPVDPEPDQLRGTVFLKGEQATVLRRRELRAAQEAQEELYRPHWNTCAVITKVQRKGKWA